MGKRIVHILIVSMLCSTAAFAQRTPVVPPAGSVLADGTIVPELDPIITGSTGLSAPQTPPPMNFEACDADCQAEKLGIIFDE